jgi:glycosyltransferase involved in cell wall biosynthesis
MRVALLANYIAPYRLPLYEEIHHRLAEFKILLSTRMESGRHWEPNWGDLPVLLQRNISFAGEWKHPNHFSEPLTIQFPYDTVPQLLQYRPDVVISYEMGMRSLQAALYRSLVRKTQLIIWATISDVTEQGRGHLRHWLRSALLRRADAVFVSGESGARYIRRFGVKPQKLYVIPFTTGLDPFLAIPLARETGVRSRLIYSGALTERKGLLPFLTQLTNWALRNPHRKVEFHLIGDGPLRSQISDFRVPKNLEVRVLGQVAYDQLPNVYANGGILAFPTLADDWGLVVTEAMASGLPVFGSVYSQAVEELVVDGEGGWTFRPDHPEELRLKLDRALGSPADALHRMGAVARAAVRDITPATVADSIMRAVENVRVKRPAKS